MKLEIGKKYISRGHNVYGPLEAMPAGHRHQIEKRDTHYDFATGMSWQPDGTYHRVQHNCVHDLVAEVQSVGAGLSDAIPVDPYDTAAQDVLAEVRRAKELWPRDFYNAHEGYAALLEEVDEFWDEVKINQKKRDPAKMRKEAIQIAAMALQCAVEVCGEETGRR